MTFWVAGATIGSSLIGSSASDAANSSAQHSAEQAQGQQAVQNARTYADTADYRYAGYGALDQINALLGITPRAPLGEPLDLRSQIRERLKPQYTGAYGGNMVNDPALDAAVDAEMAKIPADDPRRAPNYGVSGVGQGVSTANALQALQSQPGYQFGFDQGQKAIDQSAAANGRLYSGATLKALQRYGQDYAGTKLGDTFNRLAQVAGIGQASQAQANAAGQNYANNNAAIGVNAGNFAAGNALNQGNIFSNAINGLSAYGDRNGWFKPTPDPSGSIGGSGFKAPSGFGF